MLILLPLFLLRPNRSSKAWWIWLPVGITALAGTALVFLLTDEELSLPQAVCSFIIGLAAVWLLMPYLKGRQRIGTFFKVLPVLAGFSLLALVPTLLADHSGWLDLRPYLAALLALASLAATLALTFGGLSVRRRFGRIRFLVWLAVWTVLAWTVIASSFVIIGSLNGDIDWGPSLLAILYTSASSLGLLLPLVLLSFFQPFYRARFFSLLNLPQPGPSSGAATPPRIPNVYQPK
jgi:multisubunit Na+/H+ antiporter MnhE subunit